MEKRLKSHLQKVSHVASHQALKQIETIRGRVQFKGASVTGLVLAADTVRRQGGLHGLKPPLTTDSQLGADTIG